MKIFRIFFLAGFLMVSSGTTFGADSIQKLFNIMQEKLTKYQRIMSDVKSSAARKLQAAKDYTNAKTAFETAKAAYSRISPASAPNSDPTSGIPLAETFDNLGAAIDKISSKAKIKEEDLDLKFPSTRDNSLELKMGEDFWQNVTKDIKNASSSIHIQMFGMEADKTGWEFARLLAEKAKSGVEVFLVADRSGARMMGPGNVFKTTEEEKLFKFYKDNGVKVVFYDRISRGTSLLKKLDFFHFDHRKMFIFDGKKAYTGGYTLQQPSREKKHDMMIQAEGSIVGQMQASFLLNYRYNGGVLTAKTKEEIQEKYFRPPEKNGGMDAALQLNIPRGRHELTDTYIKEIDSAKKFLYIINPYITNDDMVKRICAAAKRGVRVEIIHPGSAENPINDVNTRYHFAAMLKAGVKIHMYQGENGLGKLHGKGILRDDEFLSIGSCNMDTMALRHNYEQNIISRDREFVAKVRRDLFEKDFSLSTIYVPPKGFWNKTWQNIKGKASQILDRFD